MALVVSYNCNQNEQVCGGTFNIAILQSFFKITKTDDISMNTGLDLTTEFSKATGDLTKQETSAVSGIGIVGVFLDGLKLVASSLALLTPLPIIIFINSLFLPFFINILIAVPLFVLYVIGLIEFVRGVQL